MFWQKYFCLKCLKKKTTAAFFAFVLFICILYFKFNKILLQNRQQKTDFEMLNDLINASHEHLFIYSSFVYDKRPNVVHDITTSTTSTMHHHHYLVVLYLAEKSHKLMNNNDIQCIATNNTTKEMEMETKKEHVHSLGVCALELFVLTCKIDARNKNNNNYHLAFLLENKEEEEERQERRTFKEEEERQERRTFKEEEERQERRTFVKLSPKRPSYKKRGLVLCMSRIFLFERWQLLVTGLEAYRMFKVGLVVVQVQSALSSVFEVLKAYEHEEFVKIEPGIRFQHFRGMKWDPNAETEFNGQILLAHECFYEYRESAQFIGLIDWDDLLVPSRHFRDLPSAFSAALKQRPDTAYFLVNKIEASFVQQKAESPAEFSLSEMLMDGIRTAEMYNDEKMVVRPKQLRGFWMHNSNNVETNMQAVKLFTNYSMLLHLANDERVNEDEFVTNFMSKFNVIKMDKQTRKKLWKIKNLRMPSTQPFYDALVKCHGQLFAFYKTVGSGRSGCLSYSLCALPRLPLAICTVTKSTFDTVATGTTVFHVRTSSKFAQERCIDRGGI